ncbi:MAG: N-acetylmuramoyl-L-alanine amidase [Saprospiraceae bacterium]|jgi:N-acetylmuramoyl-L-alanine amidase|nr:N-acetylmuramoyl-L-alanine amidase [Saprospiraceae bacterium]
MFKGIFESLSNFFSSLFGQRPEPKPIPKPPIDKEDKEIESTIQDAPEVPVESISTINEADILEDPFIPIEEPSTSPNSTQPKANTGTVSNIPLEEKTDATTPEEKQKEKIEAAKSKSRYLWCLDNGHGKLQAGKRSPRFTYKGQEVQLLEYKFNRDIVERIMKSLDQYGINYFDIVPDYKEVGSFLKNRVERANKKTSSLPKIYLSVHGNAGPRSHGDWTNASGIETWYHSKKGEKIAAIFQRYLTTNLPNWRNRHLKSTSIKGLYVLKHTNMPAVLTENGFYNNLREAKEMMDDSVRQKIADAHVSAILYIEKHGF